MKRNKIKISKAENTFDVFNICLMCVVIVVTFYPIWYVLCASFSDANGFISHKGMLLWPIDFNFDGYKAMFKNPMILRGYGNTLYIVCTTLIINYFLTAIGAYVASRKNLKYSKFVMVLMVFTMYFSGGMIPTYFNIKSLGLLDSFWAIILPGSISTFNLIILKAAFENIPSALEESAELDGASNFSILFRIILPLTKPTVSVIMLYYAVAHWNGWFNAMLYLSDRNMFPLQMILREILIENDTTNMVMGINTSDKALISEIIKYSVIVVATAPVLCIYPFIQKYFEKGIMIGSVKG